MRLLHNLPRRVAEGNVALVHGSWPRLQGAHVLHEQREDTLDQQRCPQGHISLDVGWIGEKGWWQWGDGRLLWPRWWHDPPCRRDQRLKQALRGGGNAGDRVHGRGHRGGGDRRSGECNVLLGLLLLGLELLRRRLVRGHGCAQLVKVCHSKHVRWCVGHGQRGLDGVPCRDDRWVGNDDLDRCFLGCSSFVLVPTSASSIFDGLPIVFGHGRDRNQRDASRVSGSGDSICVGSVEVEGSLGEHESKLDNVMVASTPVKSPTVYCTHGYHERCCGERDREV